MPRKAAITPNIHLHTTVNAQLYRQLEASLFSELEGRIPKGELQAWLERRIGEYFSTVPVDMAELVDDILPGEHQFRATPETIAYLKERLNVHA